MKKVETWTCRGCSGAKREIWCWDCDIHFSGKTLTEVREDKAVRDLDMALSLLDPEMPPTA